MPLSRRDALNGAAGAAAAALLSGTSGALVKSGDGSKISVFGVGGASSPYTAGVQKGGKVEYSERGAEELAFFKERLDASRARLATTIDPIKGKSWDDVQSRIRLVMSEVRNYMIKYMETIPDKSTSKSANQAYADFKLAIENLDYAAVTKNQAKATKSFNSAIGLYIIVLCKDHSYHLLTMKYTDAFAILNSSFKTRRGATL